MNAPARNAYAIYQKNEIEGLSPGEIVCRLYQKLNGKLQAARSAIQEGQAAAKGENLGRALAIIGELQASLNLEEGGEIAANLNDLYHFLTMELTMAALRNDVDRLTKAIRIVEPLADAWEQIARQDKGHGKDAVDQTQPGGLQPFHVTY